MGGIMANPLKSAMEDQLKKSQDFMISQQRVILERQLQIQSEMAKRQMALGIARAQDLSIYLGSFLCLYTVGAIANLSRTGNKTMFIPLLPLSFITFYWIDMGYLKKMERVKIAAESILKETEYLGLPSGPPNFELIEKLRLSTKK